MFEHDLFKLNASVAEALKSVSSLKNLFAWLQQYENVAKLRDVEKQLEARFIVLERFFEYGQDGSGVKSAIPMLNGN